MVLLMYELTADYLYIWFVLEMTADSNSLQDLLQCMGLTCVVWEKLKV